jgi:hypothetical protein
MWLCNPNRFRGSLEPPAEKQNQSFSALLQFFLRGRFPRFPSAADSGLPLVRDLDKPFGWSALTVENLLDRKREKKIKKSVAIDLVL